MKYTLASKGYRPIVVETVTSQTILYSAGATAVYVKSIKKLDEPYNRSICDYSVSDLADKINHQQYRKGRRHYEIQEFIDQTLRAFQLAARFNVFVTNTDGSSRTTVISAIGASLLRAKYEIVPLGISFGKYNNELVYDLNYEQDSTGQGDCAVSYKITPQACGAIYILYEGTMSVDEFVTGLENSAAYAITLYTTIKQNAFQ